MGEPRIMENVDEKSKLPLAVSWLAENDLLMKAGLLLGYVFIRDQHGKYVGATDTGVEALVVASGSVAKFEWATDHLLFTVAQLLELGFEPGEFKYCLHCKRLQVECDQEQADIAAYNAEEG